MGDFQHGICGCCSNCKTMLCTWCCPCIVAGKIGEKVGDSCCLCGLCVFIPIGHWISAAMLRQKVREQKGISGSLCMDLVCALVCYPCVLCQAADEVGAMDMAQQMVRE